MTDKKENLTFKDYYDKKANEKPHIELRDQICERLQIPIPTFYDKIKNDRFRKVEKQIISEITGIPITVLFPETEIESA